MKKRVATTSSLGFESKREIFRSDRDSKEVLVQKLCLSQLIILELQFKLGKGGLSGALSDALTQLVFQNVVDLNTVHFTQKGTGALSLYAAAMLQGNMDVQLYLNDKGITPQHFEPVPGGNFKLGTTPKIAIGMAMAYKKMGVTRPVIVSLCEGDLGPGGMDVYAPMASQLGINNVVFILDKNGLGSVHKMDSLVTKNQEEDTWKQFGWAVVKADNTDVGSLTAAFERIGKEDKPLLIVAQGAPKGWGYAELENSQTSNHRLPTKQDYARNLMIKLHQCHTLIFGDSPT